MSPCLSDYHEPAYRSDGHSRSCTCSHRTRIKGKHFRHLIFEVLGNKEQHLAEILPIASSALRDAREMVVVVVIANDSTRTSYKKRRIDQESCRLSLRITYNNDVNLLLLASLLCRTLSSFRRFRRLSSFSNFRSYLFSSSSGLRCSSLSSLRCCLNCLGCCLRLCFNEAL